MDDVLLFTCKDSRWDEEAFLRDFTRSECYWKPLRLEDAEPGKFLETTYFKQGNELHYRLKNENETDRKVWRYHDYRSRMDYTVKRATIMSTLRKVNAMASDDVQLILSAKAKCREFLDLNYPAGILRHMCSTIARDTANMAWLTVKHSLPPYKSTSSSPSYDMNYPLGQDLQ